MKFRRWLVCGVVVIAVGLLGCSNEAEKLQLENQQLRKENTTLKKDLAAVSKSLENSLSFPAGWGNQTSAVKELDEFEKPGTYEGTHDLTFGDGTREHRENLSRIVYANGGTCLVNATVERRGAGTEPVYLLQILTYQRQQQVYRVVNVFGDNSIDVMEVQPHVAVEGEGVTGDRKRKWRPVYSSNLPETAELQMNIGINEARDEVEWNWAVIEGQKTMISGKGIKQRVE